MHFQILRIVLIYKIKKLHLTRLFQTLGRYIEITNFLSSQYCTYYTARLYKTEMWLSTHARNIDDVKRQGIYL